MIEEVEILENHDVENNNNNNQTKKDNINLDKPLETKELLDKVRKDLYNAMCYYWKILPEDYLVSTILDPKIKSMGNKIIEKEFYVKNLKNIKKIIHQLLMNLVLHL